MSTKKDEREKIRLAVGALKGKITQREIATAIGIDHGRVRSFVSSGSLADDKLILLAEYLRARGLLPDDDHAPLGRHAVPATPTVIDIAIVEIEALHLHLVSPHYSQEAKLRKLFLWAEGVLEDRAALLAIHQKQ